MLNLAGCSNVLVNCRYYGRHNCCSLTIRSEKLSVRIAANARLQERFAAEKKEVDLIATTTSPASERARQTRPANPCRRSMACDGFFLVSMGSSARRRGHSRLSIAAADRLLPVLDAGQKLPPGSFRGDEKEQHVTLVQPFTRSSRCGRNS
jgi:hypothetical protein